MLVQFEFKWYKMVWTKFANCGVQDCPMVRNDYFSNRNQTNHLITQEHKLLFAERLYE